MKKRVLASMMCAVMFGACSVRAEADQDLERIRSEFRAMGERTRAVQDRLWEIRKLNVDEHRNLLEEIAQDEKEDLWVRSAVTEILNPGYVVDWKPLHNNQTIVLVPAPAEEEYHEEDEFDMFRREASLGQLCKTSDVIAVGKLIGRKKKPGHETEYTFQIGRVLDGNTRARTVSVHGVEDFPDTFTLSRIPINSMCIFFYSHTEGHHPFDYKRMSLSFEKPKRPWWVSKWFINMNDRGVIEADTETADAYEQAIKGHLKHIRSKNVLEYFDFLCGLTKSSVERIRRDSVEDLKSLIAFSASDDELAKMENDPRLTSEMNAFVQSCLRNPQSLSWKLRESKRKKTLNEKPDE